MEWFQALILGILQGLTEFLPVSSSGHLEISRQILNIEIEDSLTFDIIVHAATVCSTIVVFRKDIWNLLKGLLKFKINEETLYIGKLLLSAAPVIVIGLLLEDVISKYFFGKIILVGCMLLVTAGFLAFTYYAKQKDKSISFKDAFIIGIAQAVAVLPGMSRSGATIATALLLNNKKEEAARFSFLMVLLPILGKVGLDIVKGDLISEQMDIAPLIIGFIGAFIVGLIACRLMIAIVKKSKLIYFAIYCLFVAGVAIIYGVV